jgi:hypothetical protein
MKRWSTPKPNLLVTTSQEDANKLSTNFAPP